MLLQVPLHVAYTLIYLSNLLINLFVPFPMECVEVVLSRSRTTPPIARAILRIVYV